jgi:hypothetical protein
MLDALRRFDLEGFFAKRAGLCLTFLTILHTSLILIFFFPLSEVVRNEPIYADDYPPHQAFVINFYRYVTDFGHSWGYDPYLMAGYPSCAIYDVDIKAGELFSSLFSFLGLIAAFKLFTLATFIVVPPIVYLASRKLGLSPFEGLVAAALAIALWHLDPFVNPSIKYGMLGFGLNCSLGVLIYALLYDYLTSGRGSSCALLFLIAPLVMMLHPVSLIALVVPLGVLYVMACRTVCLRVHLLLGGVILFSVAVNSYWIVPLLQMFHYKLHSGHVFLAHGLRTIAGDFFYKPGYGMRTIVFVTGVLGLHIWKKQGALLKWVPMFCTFVFLFALAYFGSYWDVTATLQPYRYIMALSFFLIPPAAETVTRAIKISQERFLTSGGICVLVVALLLSGPLFSTSLAWLLRGRHLYCSLPAAGYELVDWIRHRTTRAGRILVQDSRGHVYFGGHFLGLLPVITEREFIGGVMPDMWIAHHFSDFSDELLFGKDLMSYDEEDLRNYFDLYNIKWVVAWSAKAKAFFETHRPSLEKVDQVGVFAIYEVNREPNFFTEGTGRVSADHNLIRVSGASRGGVVLKYHWLETLRCREIGDGARELPVEPVKMLDDPIPFIRVRNGDASSFEIYNSYRFPPRGSSPRISGS